MAGTVRARLDCYSNAGGASANIQAGRNIQAMFTTLWNLLDAHPNLTRIASHYGNSTSATQIAPPTNTRGIGYWDAAVNFGYDAFGVWRFNSALWPWYLMIELLPAQGTTIPNSGLWLGNTTCTSFSIGVSAAWGVTAGNAVGNPWNGGTANAGGDARGATRWTDPGGGVYVLPRSNNLYGTHATNKNNSVDLVRFTTGVAKLGYHLFVDDDSLIVAYDLGDLNVWAVNGICRYTPRTGLNIARPYALFNGSNTAFWPSLTGTSVYGTTAGNAIPDGGIICPDGVTGPVRPFFLERFSNVQQSASFQPSNVSGSALYDEFALKCVVSANAETTAMAGEAGNLDTGMIREVFNIPSSNTNTGLTRVFLGGSTTAALKASLPWDGTTTPRSYASGRTGVSASITP